MESDVRMCDLHMRRSFHPRERGVDIFRIFSSSLRHTDIAFLL